MNYIMLILTLIGLIELLILIVSFIYAMKDFSCGGYWSTWFEIITYGNILMLLIIGIFTIIGIVIYIMILINDMFMEIGL